MERRKLQHLYWRAGFGLSFGTLKKLNSKPKKQVVSSLFKRANSIESLSIDLSEFEILRSPNYKEVRMEMGEEKVRDLVKKSRTKVRELNVAWLDRLNNPGSELREKMTLFWANVFVCKDQSCWDIQHYNNTLRSHALGNFGDFVKAISKEASMTKYLNNRQNKKESPNENFARELMELFTLGAGNYTERDIKESARAFTGWSNRRDGSFVLVKKNHDFGVKEFMGKKGKFGGDDIIDIILEQEQCARYICTKVYKYFVNPVVNEKNLEEIIAVFYKDYNIEKLMRHIFLSKWFYKEENIGVKIKSPIELLTGIQQIVPIKFNKNIQLQYLQKMMGQILLNPVNVAGWKGGQSWIDSNTLMFRLKLPSILLNNAVINLDEKGDIEADFDQYYSRLRNRKQFIKTTISWEAFEKEYGNISPEELQTHLIMSPIHPKTNDLLSNLKIENNKDYCIQLMSIPEYQLC
jgi:uncharacterized protein (DUF1800 family)